MDPKRFVLFTNSAFLNTTIDMFPLFKLLELNSSFNGAGVSSVNRLEIFLFTTKLNYSERHSTILYESFLIIFGVIRLLVFGKSHFDT